MKNLLSGLAFFLFCFSLFAQKPVPTGAYRLLSAQYGNPPLKTAEEHGVLCYKFFVDGYWQGAFFYTKTNTWDGSCGGTYTFENGKYLENLDYFSWDSTAAGSNIVYDYSAEGRFYHQWGKINSDKYQNYVIEEMMQQVEAAEPLKHHDLEGVWILESARWGDRQYERKTTPDDVAVKIYAYPLAAYGFWNKKTHQFNGAGVARYQFDGKTSTEQLEFSVWEKPGTTQSIAISLDDGAYTQEWGGINREVWRKAAAK